MRLCSSVVVFAHVKTCVSGLPRFVQNVTLIQLYPMWVLLYVIFYIVTEETWIQIIWRRRRNFYI